MHEQEWILEALCKWGLAYQTSDFDVKMKYISDSNAIHLAGRGRGLVPWCLYISEYKCLWKEKNNISHGTVQK